MSPVGKILKNIFVGKSLLFLSHSIILPILPLYLSDLGATMTEIGWVIGAFAFGVFLCRPLVGRVIDSRGGGGNMGCSSEAPFL